MIRINAFALYSRPCGNCETEHASGIVDSPAANAFSSLTKVQYALLKVWA